MNILRTIGWVLFTAIVVGFIFMNWGEAEMVRFWPLGDGNYLLFEWPIGFIALFFIALGFLPMWLIHRGVKWRLKRRIAMLEEAVQNSSAPVMTPPATKVHDDATAEERRAEDHPPERRDRYTPVAPNAATAPEHTRDDRIQGE